jgi:cation diffusion facilitator CzcD-associated flavoprotein CzcO
VTPASSAQPAAPRIAIVGSGFAGIGMAIRLQQMGITSFTVYEAAGDIGGTWRDNTYPGAACDVPSHLYSFSFEQNPAWSRAFGSQAEIFAYLKDCARKYGVDRYVRCNARVASASFDEARQTWQVEIDSNGTRENIEVDVVIAASGPLSRPASARAAASAASGG